jgi:UDP-N-acetylglucosamine--N-acetylmuramyl-(pentapeptide) pyrophosphoryl-undecaprenol N-acetylglucosamine transferase
VRREIFGGDHARAARRFGFVSGDDALPTVYVTGGAQGSRIHQSGRRGVFADLLALARVVHQCGRQPTEPNRI